jgi:hypothetical protein
LGQITIKSPASPGKNQGKANLTRLSENSTYFFDSRQFYTCGNRRVRFLGILTKGDPFGAAHIDLATI